jgi:hypothetical protein
MIRLCGRAIPYDMGVQGQFYEEVYPTIGFFAVYGVITFM